MSSYGVEAYGVDSYGGYTDFVAPTPTGLVFPTLLLQEAFRTNPLATRPAWDSVDIDDLRTFDVLQNGRTSQLDRPSAGSANFDIDISRTRDVDPLNPASPHAPNVVPGNRIRFRFSWLGSVFPMFDGFVNAHNPRYEMPNDAFCAIPAGDMFKILARTALAGMPERPRERTDYRVKAILNFVGIRTNRRRVGRCRTFVEAEDISDRTALEALMQLDDTEVGRMTVDPDGTFVFLSRRDMQQATRQTTPQAVFSDSLVSGTIPYQTITLENSDTLIRNIIEITSPFADPVVAIDEASRDRYGPNSYPREVRDIAPAARRATAEHFLLANSQPMTRVLGVTVLVSDTPAGYPHGLFGAMGSLRVGDRVTVERTKIPGGGATFSQDCFIESKSDTASQVDKTWTCALGLSFAPPVVEGGRWGSGEWGSAKWVF